MSSRDSWCDPQMGPCGPFPSTAALVAAELLDRFSFALAIDSFRVDGRDQKYRRRLISIRLRSLSRHR